MKTSWKILLTFGILTAFILIIAALIVFLTTGFGGETPLIGGGYVAVIPIKGEITGGDCGTSLLGGTTACANVQEIKNSIQEANDDGTVEGILLDIDSGGGSDVATRELASAVKSSKKPVVAYIGESGASGAYYVASYARKIIADEHSITGSIGVKMEIMQYYDLMGKVGVNVTTIKSSEMKDIGSPYRPMTEDERKDLQDLVDKVYEDFITTVATNRNLDVEYVRNLADGRIYLGSDAKELKLVDEVGSFDYAVNVTAEEAGIKENPKVKDITPSRSIGSLFSQQLSGVVIYNLVKYLR
jgi:protease-4